MFCQARRCNTTLPKLNVRPQTLSLLDDNPAGSCVKLDHSAGLLIGRAPELFSLLRVHVGQLPISKSAHDDVAVRSLGLMGPLPPFCSVHADLIFQTAVELSGGASPHHHRVSLPQPPCICLRRQGADARQHGPSTSKLKWVRHAPMILDHSLLSLWGN